MAGDGGLPGARPSGRPGVGPEIVGVWPAAVWIVVGTLVFLGDPERFSGWKGGLYYVLGTGVVALVGGVAGLSARRRMVGVRERLLNDLRDQGALIVPMVTLGLRLVVGLVEAVVVTLLALWVLDLLG